jgi:hypothetical protein
VSQGEDATEDREEPPVSNPIVDDIVGESKAPYLSTRDDAFLTRGE